MADASLPCCYFCGGDVVVKDDGGGRIGSEVRVTPQWYWVECTGIDCRARGPKKSTELMARVSWNLGR